MPALPRSLLSSFGFFRLCFFPVFLLGAVCLFAQTEAPADSVAPASGAPANPAPNIVRWYRSNASGMALEPIPSRFAALRSEYCLSIGSASPEEIPPLILPFYDNLYRTETRVLYENGKEIRRQWNFRDSQDLARLTASGTAGLFGKASSADEKKSGFIELRDAGGLITREFQFAEDLSETDIRYFYTGSRLTKVETWFKAAPPAPDSSGSNAAPVAADSSGSSAAPVAADSSGSSAAPAVTDSGGSGAAPVAADSSGSSAAPVAADSGGSSAAPVFVQMYTDYYNYTRSGSLRAIDRTLLQGDAGAKLSRISFPRLGLDFSSGNVMVSQGAGTSSEFLTDVNTPEGTQITYTLDSRGRILTEVWKDKDGGQIGVFTNTWSGDRLQSVLWKSDDDERLVEYDYDSDGNRSAERDFRQGVLERSVISQGNKDTENIYMNGKLILRAHWENGMKISEERIYSPGAKQ